MPTIPAAMRPQSGGTPNSNTACPATRHHRTGTTSGLRGYGWPMNARNPIVKTVVGHGKPNVCRAGQLWPASTAHDRSR